MGKRMGIPSKGRAHIMLELGNGQGVHRNPQGLRCECRHNELDGYGRR